MNYRSLAMHLAARCRKRLNGWSSMSDIPDERYDREEVVVTKPEIHREYHAYTFRIAGVRRLRTLWAADVQVYWDKDVRISEQFYKLPAHVRACLNRD